MNVSHDPQASLANTSGPKLLFTNTPLRQVHRGYHSITLILETANSKV